ncbi:MAG: right-handed parallel beta-helix repeat-containing protein [Candidatus Eisenbacteria bacterium]
MMSKAGPEVTFIEICNTSSAVAIFDEGVRFSGFTVRFGSGPDCDVPPVATHGIWCKCTDAIVENCIIEGFYRGIYIDEPSLNWWKPVFRNNIIRSCSFGIAIHYVLEPGRPYVEGNVITECYTGVEVIDSSTMLADNMITNSTSDGLYYAGHCGGNCERNVIANNGGSGVFIMSADPPLAVPGFNGGLVPADANDFYGNAAYDIDYCYSHQGGVMAKWNWWGADCPDFAGKFRGRVYYEPWTDATHTLRLDPEICEQATEPTTWGAIKSIYR